MNINAIRYAKPHARVRAMISELVTPGQKRGLVVSPGLEDALRQLYSTTYGTELAGVPTDGIRLLPVEKAFERNLVNAYDRVIRSLDGPPRVLVVEMLRRCEVDNLKAILGGVVTGVGAEEVGPNLLPLGRLSRLRLDDLLAARSVTDVIDSLGNLHYARVLRGALDRYEHEQSLFPLEVALDLYYYRHLWSVVEALPSSDRAIATRMMGMRYDVINVDWMLRYKAIYHLSAEEIFNYTLPYGYKIDDEVIHRAGSAPDLSSLIAELPDPYRQLLQPLTKESGNIWQLEVGLNRYLWHGAKATLAGYPFQIGVILAFLFLKEAEIHDLKAILEGKRYGRSPDEIVAFLWGEL
ncbi:MAG: V-type ATPase subunit [Chloroflexi bacterium]|nr:V-type ATPase subunit [Chloroflexota bacterium]MDA8187769.1 V-type ATPase subunit [Dehalococcoidales bacterium]